MDFRRDEFTRTTRSPAKLNLYLNVTGRRDDGFHELETLMVAIRIWDSLSVTPLPAAGRRTGPLVLQVRHAGAVQTLGEEALPTADGDNLTIRALELLRQRSNCPLGAQVVLIKRIPVAAGLGGGSSNAAAALRMGNRVWKLGWSTHQLAHIAAEIGSDVPFFIHGRAAVCTGRGERVATIENARPLSFVIVKPPTALRTPEVYRALDALDSSRLTNRRLEAAVEAVRTGRVTQLKAAMMNGLEAAAATLSPWIDRIRAVFAELDFVAHQLSGSGSAYFGLCRHWQHARRLATILRRSGVGCVYATQSLP